jgi:UDP-glucose 4-epimerase
MASVDRVVLVTGVGRYLGARVAASLSTEPSFDRIIGLDVVAAGRLGRTEYVRADISHPLIGKVLDQAHVDTVVHAAPNPSVAGIASLLAACERSASVTRVVAASTTGVYGASRRDPAVFTEQMRAPSNLAPGPRRTAVEAEGYLRTLARRRPDISVSVLRFAPLIGPTVDSWLTRYLALPVVPTALGFDPRLQLLHESDAIEVLCRAALANHPGVTNVAGDGVLTLAQILRRAGRPRLPFPGFALGRIGGVAEQGLLRYGRAVDTGRLKTRLGYQPRYTTGEALRSYVESRSGRMRVAPVALAGAERLLPAGVHR